MPVYLQPLTFICPCIASISLKYNQQYATFSRSIYSYKFLYMFQAVPPPIIRSTKLYIQRQVLSNQYCFLLLSWMQWNLQRFLDLLISINFSTCLRRFLRPSSGAQNCTYGVRYCQTNTAASCYRGCNGTCNVFSISYFYKLLYMFQAVPPPTIRSTKLYIQRQVLSNQYCCYRG